MCVCVYPTGSLWKLPECMDAFCEADCRKWHLLRSKPWRRSRPGSYALNVGARHLKFKAKTIYIYIYCITVARSITVRRSSTDDHGCFASIMLAMVSSLPRVPSSFCLLFALRWLRNTGKSVARTKQCCLLSQERNLQSQSVFVFSQSEIFSLWKKQW